MKRRKNEQPVLITTSQANKIRMLVANLMDIPTPPELVAAGVPQPPSNRIPEMGNNRIEPLMLATVEIEDGEPGEHLRDQATVLRVIYALVANSTRPTPETIEQRIALELSGRGVENADQEAHDLVERVRSYRTADADVEYLSGALEGWRRRRWIESRLQDALKLVRSPESDHAVTIALLDLMRDITPDMTPITRTDLASNRKATRDKLIEAYERAQRGKSVGPEYPWRTLRELCPIIPPGHMHVWSAPTKHGKTTFANEIGRHIALNQPEYMVALFHLETDELDLGVREFARDLIIKPGDLVVGKVDLRDPKWAALLNEADQFVAERCGEGPYAKYQYIHCPDLTLQALEREIYRLKTVAAAKGWEGVVIIIDYYQIMDWAGSLPGIRDEIAGRNELASRLKNLIERANKSEFASSNATVHAIVFAQDNVFDVGRKTPFGGQQIIQRGQAQFQIIGIDDVQEDYPVYDVDKQGHAISDGKGGYLQATDGLGKPLFYHTVGDVHSQRAIHLVRGNQVKPGYAFVQMTNGYFGIVETIDAKPRWWSEYIEKMDKRKKRSTV